MRGALGRSRCAGIHSWLHWDESAGRLVVFSNRDWRGERASRLRRDAPAPPLTTSMVAVVLATLCQDGDSYYQREIVHGGLIGSAAVTVAMRALVTQPDVSPARMVKLLESDATFLPVLWPVLVE